MSKLYPPNIKGTLPAFTGTTIVVPYEMNRAVSFNSVGGIALKIKTISGKEIGSYQTDSFTETSATFINVQGLNPGQFYKLQLAYIDKSLEKISITTTQNSILVGDVTGDGSVNEDDIQLVKNQEPTYFSDIQITAADVDLNRKITNADATKMYAVILGKSSFEYKYCTCVSYAGAQIGFIYTDEKYYIQALREGVISIYSNTPINAGTAIEIFSYPKDSEGYYSTVGIAKCTNEPIVQIDDLVTDQDNSYIYSYTGRYINQDDSETVYTNRFDIYRLDTNELVLTSGDLLHNVNPDINNISLEKWGSSYWLDERYKYKIIYTVTTVNGLVRSTPEYILNVNTARQDIPRVSFIAENNYDNGYLELITDFWGSGKSDVSNYEIFIMRSEDQRTWRRVSRIDPSVNVCEHWNWRDFTVEQGKNYFYRLQFPLKTAAGTSYVWMRFQNQDGSYVMGPYIGADFEDAFLYDGEKQLKLRFNPKVSSFKTTILEQKIDTIGGKYPFFFRNGQVGYKEFQISGLLSYQQDESNLFISDEELGLVPEKARREITNTLAFEEVNVSSKSFVPNGYYIQRNGKYILHEYVLYIREVETEDEQKLAKKEFNKALSLNKKLYTRFKGIYDQYASKEYINQDYYIDTNQEYNSEEHYFIIANREPTAPRTTSLLGYNYTAERIFKLKVLDWLNNGKPKLFRSPQEGNYLVRLMNVSLSPEDQLGRMLHNFSATAYEIDNSEYETLIKYRIAEGFKND